MLKRWSPTFIFILAVSFFMLGIILSSVSFVLIVILPGFLIWLAFKFKNFNSVFLFCAALIAGFFSFNIAQYSYNAKSDALLNKKVFNLVVVSPADLRDKYQILTAKDLSGSGQKLIIKTDKNLTFHPGDILQVTGSAEKINDAGIF
ncbi:MAG: hypothetical protein ACYDBV_14325 [Nitrospiria bacterium]